MTTHHLRGRPGLRCPRCPLVPTVPDRDTLITWAWFRTTGCELSLHKLFSKQLCALAGAQPWKLAGGQGAKPHVRDCLALGSPQLSLSLSCVIYSSSLSGFSVNPFVSPEFPTHKKRALDFVSQQLRQATEHLTAVNNAFCSTASGFKSAFSKADPNEKPGRRRRGQGCGPGGELPWEEGFCPRARLSWNVSTSCSLVTCGWTGACRPSQSQRHCGFLGSNRSALAKLSAVSWLSQHARHLGFIEDFTKLETQLPSPSPKPNACV